MRKLRGQGFEIKQLNIGLVLDAIELSRIIHRVSTWSGLFLLNLLGALMYFSDECIFFKYGFCQHLITFEFSNKCNSTLSKVSFNSLS